MEGKLRGYVIKDFINGWACPLGSLIRLPCSRVWRVFPRTKRRLDVIFGPTMKSKRKVVLTHTLKLSYDFKNGIIIRSNPF